MCVREREREREQEKEKETEDYKWFDGRFVAILCDFIVFLDGRVERCVVNLLIKFMTEALRPEKILPGVG